MSGIVPFYAPAATWSFVCASGGIINNTAVTIAAAAGISARNLLRSLQLQNVHATVATEVIILDQGGATLFRCYLPALMITPVNFTFDPRVQGASNTAMQIQCVTTGAQVYANAQGYQGPDM